MNITLDTVRAHVRINRHRLDEELELQPEFAFWIGRKVATLEARTAAAADDLKRVEARISIDTRERAEKTTEKEVEATVRRHRDRIAAFEAHNLLVLELGEWRAAQEAWSQRSYSLKDLANLYSSEYWATRSTSVSAATDREISMEGARLRLREASENVSATRTRVRVG